MRTLLVSLFVMASAQANMYGVLSHYSQQADQWIQTLNSSTLSNGTKLRYSKQKLNKYRYELQSYQSMVDISYVTSSQELSNKLNQIEKDINQQKFKAAALKIAKLKKLNY